MRRQNILITGCTGQIGYELKRLLNPLADVICPSRAQFDLSKPDSLGKKIKSWSPDLIINAAAYTSVDQAEYNADLVFIVNAIAPKIIAQEASDLNIPLIHFSTDYVFDGNKLGSYVEDDAPSPINIYGESKLKSEQYIIKNNKKSLIFRTSWIYGNCGNNFLTTIRKLLQSKSSLNIIDDQFGAPTWSYEVAHAIVEIIKQINSKDFNKWGLYHLSASGSTTWFNFAKSIKNENIPNSKAELYPIDSIGYNSVAKRPLNSILDNNKLLESLGIELPSWEVSLKKCIKLDITK